jgi:hypothetical protein
MHLHYGIVSLKGRPLTQVAERFLEFVLEAEHEAVSEDERLVARFASGSAARRTRRSIARPGRTG